MIKKILNKFLNKSKKRQKVQAEPEKILYQSSNRLEGKNVIIIGGGKGIGKAIANRFANEGAKILINSRSKTDLENVKKEIENNNGECSYFEGDITDTKTIKNLFLESKSKLGKLDILINCAGTVDFGSIENFNTIFAMFNFPFF